jgi:hypothetical protein
MNWSPDFALRATTGTRLRAVLPAEASAKAGELRRQEKWSQVRVTIPAVDPYERSLLSNEALRDETWKRV